MIGSFGEIPFTSSADKVFTFNNFSKSGEARFESHEVLGQKPILEFIGPGSESITLSIRLDVALGINPLAEIKKLVAIRDEGEALPLVIAGEYKGDYALRSISEAHKHHDNRGRLLVADLSLTLEEYNG